jgi:hypothetical protein
LSSDIVNIFEKIFSPQDERRIYSYPLFSRIHYASVKIPTIHCPVRVFSSDKFNSHCFSGERVRNRIF